MRCRDCPYGIEDFTLRTEMYKSVYGEYPDEDRANQSEQFVWCDKVGGKVYSFGHCSDWYAHDEEKYKNHSKKKRINMCNRCDYDSPDNQIYVDPLTNEYYLDIETSEWDEYDDGFVHQKEYIAYCPWCGRKLGE